MNTTDWCCNYPNCDGGPQSGYCHIKCRIALGHNAQMRKLPRVKSRIFEIISARPGVSAEELVSLVWAEDPSGGPLSGRKCIHVHIHGLNRLLAREGMHIKGHVTDGYHLLSYKDVSLEQ